MSFTRPTSVTPADIRKKYLMYKAKQGTTSKKSIIGSGRYPGIPTSRKAYPAVEGPDNPSWKRRQITTKVRKPISRFMK